MTGWIRSLFILALFASFAAEAATVTTKTTVTNSAWTDLGAGPMLLSFRGAGLYAISDTTPSLVQEGFTVASGDSVPLNTTSHVWAMASGAPSVDAYAAPITPSGGGGGGAAGSVTPDVSGLLVQRSGTQAQAFRVYNTYTDASNGEWAALDWQTTANVLTIGTQKNGTGTARNVKFVSGAATILDYGVTAAFAWTINGPLIPTVTTYALGSTAKPWQTIVGTTYWSGSTTGVSCAAGTVSATTMVVTGGIVTHC